MQENNWENAIRHAISQTLLSSMFCSLLSEFSFSKFRLRHLLTSLNYVRRAVTVAPWKIYWFPVLASVKLFLGSDWAAHKTQRWCECLFQPEIVFVHVFRMNEACIFGLKSGALFFFFLGGVQEETRVYLDNCLHQNLCIFFFFFHEWTRTELLQLQIGYVRQAAMKTRLCKPDRNKLCLACVEFWWHPASTEETTVVACDALCCKNFPMTWRVLCVSVWTHLFVYIVCEFNKDDKTKEILCCKLFLFHISDSTSCQ